MVWRHLVATARVVANRAGSVAIVVKGLVVRAKAFFAVLGGHKFSVLVDAVREASLEHRRNNYECIFGGSSMQQRDRLVVHMCMSWDES